MKTFLTLQTSWSLIALLLLLLAHSAIASPSHSSGQLVEEPLFSDASPCSRCHDDLTATTDTGGEDISFAHHWGKSMMRFSFFDPFWRAKVKAETMRLPGLAVLIEDKCSRCHAPMANVQAAADGSEVRIFGEGGFLDPKSPYTMLATDGVSCTLCHQIVEPQGNWDEIILAKAYDNSGGFLINQERVAFGKYSPQYAQTMTNATGFKPLSAPHLHQSAFCAVCHDLYTDYVDEDGVKQSTPETIFPEQTPYIEWLTSIYSTGEGARSCQDCHMKRYPGARISLRPQKTGLRENVYAHTFLSENSMMLKMISSLAEEQGIDIPDLDDAITDARDYLASAGSIEIEDVAILRNELVVKVRVTNDCGHKLPTSIPVRRVFIHFAVYDGEPETGGNLLFSSGNTDSQGGIIGVDDTHQPLGYEPHYNLISREDQVQIYEGVMGNWEGEVTYTLLRASSFLKDNRILPPGWDDGFAPLEIFPRGEALADPDFIGGEDTITYRVRLREMRPGQELVVEAELKDQTLSHPMVHDLQALQEQDDSGVIRQFLEEYDHHKVHFELIASHRAKVVLP